MWQRLLSLCHIVYKSPFSAFNHFHDCPSWPGHADVARVEGHNGLRPTQDPFGVLGAGVDAAVGHGFAKVVVPEGGVHGHPAAYERNKLYSLCANALNGAILYRNSRIYFGLSRFFPATFPG